MYLIYKVSTKSLLIEQAATFVGDVLGIYVQ